MISDWREQWHRGTGGASDPLFPFGWMQLNSCYRAVWEESRTQPPVPIATNWSYQNPKVQPGAVRDPLGAWLTSKTSSSCTPGQPRGTPCKGQGDGFPSVRWAFTQSLARVNRSFQAVILDTPSAYGSVHSPLKQTAGSRLARAALATIYGLTEYDVSPFVKGVVLDAASSVVKISLGGLGPGGIQPPRSAAGFELLCKDDVWHSALCTTTAVAGANITLPVPHDCAAPRAVRYLWYDTPCGNYPYQCPIYTATTKLGGLSGEQDFLPLGPFIETIQVEELGVRTKTDDEDEQMDKTIDCDIAIAGGSTASLAAAITAAEAAPELHVCFTDPTDWPGGQMTAGGVPAIDFGGPNDLQANQPASFADAMASIPGSGSRWNSKTFEGSGSPGACSVSTKCYLPNVLVESWIMPRLRKSKNLSVFLRTAVRNTTRSPGGDITALTVVQRTPRPSTVEWSQRLSVELPDWYSPTDSAAFTKQSLTLSAKVFIEGTELGDVLATSGLPFAQGIEVPKETSTTYENCGQVNTLGTGHPHILIPVCCLERIRRTSQLKLVSAGPDLDVLPATAAEKRSSATSHPPSSGWWWRRFLLSQCNSVGNHAVQQIGAVQAWALAAGFYVATCILCRSQPFVIRCERR